MRGPEDKWVLNRFFVDRFEVLGTESLSATLMRLRAIPLTWGDDAISDLIRLRHGKGDNDPAA